MCRQMLDEVEIRELLIDHVGHRCCWGSRPARTWRIRAVEDCDVYVGTLETFIEERDSIKETEPYLGGDIDGKDKGLELGIWELDLRSQFPVLFIPHQESKAKIPHSEIIEKCSGETLEISIYGWVTVNQGIAFSFHKFVPNGVDFRTIGSLNWYYFYCPGYFK